MARNFVEILACVKILRSSVICFIRTCMSRLVESADSFYYNKCEYYNVFQLSADQLKTNCKVIWWPHYKFTSLGIVCLNFYIPTGVVTEKNNSVTDVVLWYRNNRLLCTDRYLFLMWQYTVFFRCYLPDLQLSKFSSVRTKQGFHINCTWSRTTWQVKVNI